MSYAVKELFYTLQGEGMNTGRAAVFCRFAGCNLWSGREEDREGAQCSFCDTDFVGVNGDGGGVFTTSSELAGAVNDTWKRYATGGARFVVCTGGEPTLQLDSSLVDALHHRGFEIAIETNGTRKVPAGVDHICVSPKAGAPLVQDHGDELKIVYPQEGIEPAAFTVLDFGRFYLQPMDGPNRTSNARAAVDFCLRFPRWRLSLQTHKNLGIR